MQVLHWQLLKFIVFKCFMKDDTVGAFFAADGNWFQILELGANVHI